MVPLEGFYQKRSFNNFDIFLVGESLTFDPTWPKRIFSCLTFSIINKEENKNKLENLDPLHCINLYYFSSSNAFNYK